jgi:glycosyltransferase involved in cell wall biosynthesis
MKILILASASVTAVHRAATRLQTKYPDASVVIGVTEVEQKVFEGSGYSTWVMGESSLQLDTPQLRKAVVDQSFELFSIPLGLPKQILLFVARFVRNLGRERCVIDAPFVRHLTWWPLVWLVLVGYSLLLALPVVMVVRCGLVLDGVLLLAGQLLARSRHRYWRPSSGQGPVCHIISSLGTGGAQRQLVGYLQCSQLEKQQLRLLTLFEDNDFFSGELDSIGIAAEPLRTGVRSWLQGIIARALPMSSTLWLLLLRLRRLQPSCVYSWMFGANVIAAPAARLAGVPKVISSVRNLSRWKTWPEYRRWWMRLADRLSAPLNDCLVANAQAVAADYQGWASVSSEQVRVIANGVDVDELLARPSVDLRAQLGIAAEVPIVLTIGRLAREKRQEMLLRACARVRDHGLDFRLLVGGHGELEPELRRLSEALDLDDRVYFAGKIEQPQSFFRAADLFALSSDIEGMPNVVIEAQAFAVAVVTTDSGGSAEVVVDGTTGIIVETGDEGAMADAIIKLLEDPVLRTEMGRWGQRRVRLELSIERMSAAIDALCQEA